MDEVALHALQWADVNHCDALRIALAGADGTEVREFDGVVVTHCGVRVRQFNVAFVLRPVADPDCTLAAVHAFYAERERPYSVCLREGAHPEVEDAARARGLARARTTPAMTLAPIPDAPDPPAGLELRRVDGDAGLAGFLGVSSEAFGLPLVLAERFVGGRFLRHPAVTLFVGRVDGEAVAASALVRTGGVAGVYWVGTRAAHRGRGYGEALTWAACREGARLHCDLASLQASEVGRPIYARMGFRTDPPYLHYQPPRPNE